MSFSKQCARDPPRSVLSFSDCQKRLPGPSVSWKQWPKGTDLSSASTNHLSAGLLFGFGARPKCLDPLATINATRKQKVRSQVATVQLNKVSVPRKLSPPPPLFCAILHEIKSCSWVSCVLLVNTSIGGQKRSYCNPRSQRMTQGFHEKRFLFAVSMCLL